MRGPLPRQIVVADHEERRDPGCAQPTQAPRELALLRLLGLAVLVGVAREDDRVDAFGQGVVDEVVEGSDEVLHPARPTQLRHGPPVVFDTNVKICEMENAH